ncbi:putative reverse transcriptase zinc-binding domain-containing protein [Helianthus annuus]|uniref:Reverse transcriptase zinc-binding domain-containing protein n=1 Tax=Helianthus annuus TaxID=4232 RepID=A0A9K3N0S0_HELAN|nr:putative reverse transcriptase zinc-binding domain-containing protein [Helianthus annuus]KAJ0509680.1 putative reverse transcriptase zinc-binding domain-containing protein [Helianthus annuus]KAJ0875390.1 putative reverse transcriptase zinc-binding domain-containing protein [Helianthus annuus]
MRRVVFRLNLLKICRKRRGDGTAPTFKLCKWVPLKCNIMVWRANLEKLATRMNVGKRNVNIPSVSCPFYEEQEESVERLFTACLFTNRVWMSFSEWCNILPLYVSAFKDLMEAHKYLQMGEKAYSWPHFSQMLVHMEREE